MSVSITIGNKAEFTITRSNRLFVVQRDDKGKILTSVDLGLATNLRIENLQDYLGRLYCHAVEDDPKKGVYL
jgi:hypothetical protein